ncbi:MAG: hypothetical protein Q4F72_05180 [Desulfovibrionaceae bacterium]|nr:hypothetical protein [Desulfovibrionaceae bacterium]
MVRVSGGDENFCDDFASLVTSTLQSRLGTRPAYSADDADVVVDIDVKDIYLAASDGVRLNASQTLANTAVGTSLGLVVGSLAGRRTGALIGAGVGAALGLTVSAADAQRVETWAISADICFDRLDEEPVTQQYSASVTDTGMSREDAVMALEDMLSQDLAAAMR